jgi:nitrite reductase/ring-hydroxylating ferredoxin subunit
MPSSASNPWLYAGPASALTNIEPSAAPKTKITNPADGPPPCIILQLPDPASSPSNDTTQTPQRLTPSEAQETIGLSPQILIFRYRNKLHAINHSCPHRTHPLSRGSLYDIEDFGIVFSAGITCPGHGWAFDVNTGLCDRGSYKLQVWEVESRGGEDGEEEGVWVRRKESSGRIG